MPPHSRGQADLEHPGAGTLFVHGQTFGSSSKRSSLIAGARSRSKTPVRLRPSSNSRSRERATDKLAKWPLEWQDVSTAKEESSTLLPTAADVLLSRGVGDYTFVHAPEGLLGKGKFSSVYKVLGQDGKHYALKHTPLHPHHPLIAARLLREPTLLAQLPPHPCLVGVEGWIRTEGHFYLIEKYAAAHIPLHTHPLPLRPSRAAYILDQLVSVVRDCMHRGRVCHRDLKGENVLVDIETGDVVVLDLGLATQFSASEPKLTTCCGSPAFHSPEIVNALNHPPGAITYYGPELDIWCIALTLLALLSASRFPLGPSHRSRHTMASRVLDRLQELDAAYPPHRPAGNWTLSASEHEHESKEWARVRRGLRTFLEMDSRKRMEGFRRYSFGQKFKDRLEGWVADKAVDGDKGEKEEGSGGVFRQLSFIPSEVKYTLPLSIIPPPVDRSDDSSHQAQPIGLARVQVQTTAELILANPTHESDRRVLSYIKYLLRTHGILYHCIATTPLPILQLVVPLPPSPDPTSSPISSEKEGKTPTPWLTALFRRSKSTARSASLPPNAKTPRSEATAIDPAPRPDKPNAPTVYLRCYLQLECTYPARDRPAFRRAQSKPSMGSSSQTPRSGTRPRRKSSTHSQPQSRSTSLAPTFLSRASVRNGAVSPPTPPVNGGGGGEESLAVASLQQALLRITEISPPPDAKFADEVGVGWWPASPKIGTVPLAAVQVNPGNDGPDRANSVSVSISSNSGDSGNTSPVISTPTTPSPAPNAHLPVLAHAEKPGRPSYRRASTSPRLNTAALPMTTYRGLQPVSPSLALTQLPVIHPHPLSPLSRQVSQTSMTDAAIAVTNKSYSPSTVSTGPPPNQRRAASRPSSRIHSRVPSRSASVMSTSTTASSTPLAESHTALPAEPPAKPKRGPYSRANSTISSPNSSSTNTTETDNSNASNGETAPTPRMISYVLIRLSDPRALDVVRRAMDVPHEHPVALSPHHYYPELSSGTCPTDISGGRRKTSVENEEIAEEEEEERGRPRSREDPRTIGLGLSESVAAVNEVTGEEELRMGRDGKGSGRGKRDVSTGRKVFGLLGLGGGLGMGLAAVEEAEKRRGSVRTASAPPPAF